MKNILLIILSNFVFSYVCNSQSLKVAKIIIDKTTKLPIENVSIFNNKDNSSSNSDGLFVFVSNKDEINFNLLGYNPIKTTFEEIEKKDTLFMEAKSFELKEVVITNLEPFMKIVYDKMQENILSSYTSNFFLRNVLKNNDSIFKLQDIYGKKAKLSNQKKDTEIEVLNMRKSGLLEKKIPDLKFPDFNEFLNPPIPVQDKCTFIEEEYIDNDYRKISFEAKEKDDWGQTAKGYFIICRKDFAMVEYFISMYDAPEEGLFYKLLLYGTQYRTTKYERLVKLLKDATTGKYYFNQSKLNVQLEVLADKRIKKTFYYNLTMDYFSTNNPTNEKINSNFPIDKDIFKAKFPYSANFWNNQNQLPLTNELNFFLKKVSENKDKKKEFEIIGNF